LRTFAEASALLDAANHAIEDESATTRDFIRKVLIENGGPMRMVDVVEGVKLMGSTASPDTIRSVLQKMQHSGEAERPERGLYAYRAPSEPDRPVDDELTLSVALSEVEPAE
jgi:Fe2+ or Zn2+ uptake regulation protein